MYLTITQTYIYFHVIYFNEVLLFFNLNIKMKNLYQQIFYIEQIKRDFHCIYCFKKKRNIFSRKDLKNKRWKFTNFKMNAKEKQYVTKRLWITFQFN